MSESNVQRARDFRPQDHIHKVTIPSDHVTALCGATEGMAGRVWTIVTCPRCHAKGVIEVGLVAHHARAVTG